MRKKYIDPSTKREEGTNTVGEAIDNMLESYKLKRKYSEMQVLNAWEKMMGKTIASRTSKLFFKNGVLFCQVSSAPLKHKMMMNKDKMLQIIRNEFNDEALKDIVIY